MYKLKNSTVFISVKGGLGNQMFFYAFSLYLKSKGFNPQIIWFEYIYTKQHNGIELIRAFDISLDNYSKSKISFFLKINNMRLPIKLKRILGRIFKSQYFYCKLIRQTSPYNFDEIVLNFRNRPVIIDGFWQNYKYLEDIKGKVYESFQFKLPFHFSQNRFLLNINSCNSVSLHIRRGDYLDPTFKELNVIRKIDYYIHAIQLIKESVDNPIFFIFTDDLEWAKKNFIDDKYIFVDGNLNNESYLDMYLMSKCKHNIIANSTFSWWGAWLNCNSSKIVICPEMWTLDVYSSLLCPPEWIFLKI